jgi:hypothetical protein
MGRKARKLEDKKLTKRSKKGRAVVNAKLKN